MFNYNGFQQPPYGGGNSFQHPQQPFLPSRMDYMQPQPSGIQARPVTGREEAVAATVFPGTPVLFLDRAHGAVYYKAIDPQTGAAEFMVFNVAQPIQPQAAPSPQYATLADIEALRGEMASLRDMIPALPARRAKGVEQE